MRDRKRDMDAYPRRMGEKDVTIFVLLYGALRLAMVAAPDAYPTEAACVAAGTEMHRANRTVFWECREVVR